VLSQFFSLKLPLFIERVTGDMGTYFIFQPRDVSNLGDKLRKKNEPSAKAGTCRRRRIDKITNSVMVTKPY